MALPIVPIALLAAAAYAAVKLTKPTTKLDPTPVNPSAQGAIQGKTYSLLFLDASGNLDPTVTAMKLLQAGWAPVQGLPQVQRTGLPTPSGGNATEWLSVATRVGPTTISPNAGLEGFAILENAQVAA
jgi:hypothetical protein